VPVNRPEQVESTALGAAYLAGVQAEMWRPADLEKIRQTQHRFVPAMTKERRASLVAGWEAAVGRVLTRAPEPKKKKKK
jgi:glycerol kinase